jgi:hypothetical protein
MGDPCRQRWRWRRWRRHGGGSCYFLRVFTSRARIHALAAARAEPCHRIPSQWPGADVLTIPHPVPRCETGVRRAECVRSGACVLECASDVAPDTG